MSSYRAQGFLAAGFGLLVAGGTLVGCGTPDFKTNLRPAGDPEVLTALVINENFDEQATYCKPNDPKVPVVITGGCGTFFGTECCTGCVGVCPAPGEDAPPVMNAVSNAEPLEWWVRVVFDELLDGDAVETLIDATPGGTGGPCTDFSTRCTGHIDETQPFTIVCDGATIAYDGFYDPTGNNVTLPPGPSIVAYPLDFVPTSATCTLTINDVVVDKQGNPVPAAQRSGYQWQIAALAFFDITPADGATGVDPGVEITLSFNSLMDAGSVEPGEITFVDGNGDPVTFTVEADETELYLVPAADLADGDYTVTITAGTTFADIGGGEVTIDADEVITFTVAAPV
jgi:hypothetical protein